MGAGLLHCSTARMEAGPGWHCQGVGTGDSPGRNPLLTEEEIPATLPFAPSPPFSLPTAPGTAWAPFPERFVGADGSEQEAGVQARREGGEAELGEGSGTHRLLCLLPLEAPVPSQPCSADLSLLLHLSAEPVNRAGNDFPLIPKGSRECQWFPLICLCFPPSN